MENEEINDYRTYATAVKFLGENKGRDLREKIEKKSAFLAAEIRWREATAAPLALGSSLRADLIGPTAQPLEVLEGEPALAGALGTLRSNFDAIPSKKAGANVLAEVPDELWESEQFKRSIAAKAEQFQARKKYKRPRKKITLDKDGKEHYFYYEEQEGGGEEFLNNIEKTTNSPTVRDAVDWVRKLNKWGTYRPDAEKSEIVIP